MRICGRCGKSGHVGKQQCPAREATCRKCHKRGLFQSVCRTKSVKAVSTETPENNFFVGVIDDPAPLVIPTISSDPWTVNISLNDCPITFHIDTGADVSVISVEQYQQLRVPELQLSNKSLMGLSQDNVDSLLEPLLIRTKP